MRFVRLLNRILGVSRRRRKNARIRDGKVQLTILHTPTSKEPYVVRIPIDARIYEDGSIVAAITFRELIARSLKELERRTL